MIMDMFGMEKLWNMFITPVLPKKHYFLKGLLGGGNPEDEEEQRRLMESQVGTQGFNQGPTQLNPIQSQGGQFGYNAGSQGMRGLQNARRPGGSGGY